MLFQMGVALTALGVMALLFASARPPAIVYLLVMSMAVVIAVTLRAIAKHGPDVKVSFRAPPEWFGRSGGPTWMGRPVGEQLGAFWRRKATPSPVGEGPRQAAPPRER